MLVFFILVHITEIQKLGSYYIQGYYFNARVADSLLFLSTIRGFEIYDISQPNTPYQLCCVETDGEAWALDVAENYVYIADGYNGLLVFDITNIHNPNLVGEYIFSGFAEDVVINDQKVYMAAGNSLLIFDVVNPSHPQLIGEWLSTDNYLVTVFVKDTFAYLGCFPEGSLKIINVANASSPYLVAEFPDTAAPFSYSIIWDCCVVDTLAFLVGDWVYPNGNNYKFIIANVSNPTQPEFISGLNFSQPASGVVTENNHAYVNHQFYGVKIINVHNPLNPFIINNIQDAYNYGYASAIKNGILVTPERHEGFTIYDVSNPSRPISLYHHPTFQWRSFLFDDINRNLFLRGSVIRKTIENQHTNIKFIDISTLNNPVVRCEKNFLGFWTWNYGEGISLSQHILSLGIQRTFTNDYYIGILDVSDIVDPKLIRFVTGTPNCPLASQSPLILAGKDNKLLIGNINTPNFWVDSIICPEHCHSVKIIDSIIYISCRNCMVIANLYNSAIIGAYYHSHPYAGLVGGLSINDRLLFIPYSESWTGNIYKGFMIFDIGNPHSPALLIDTAITNPTNPIDYLVMVNGCYIYDDTLLFICRDRAGFDIWNVSQPNLPRKIISQDTPGYCRYIHCINDTIFVMDETAIEIYRFMTGQTIEESKWVENAPLPSIEISPNPFYCRTNIKLKNLHKPCYVEIFDALGRLIKNWMLTDSSSCIIWDGNNTNHQLVPAGVYFVIANDGVQTKNAKVILLR
ncbi:MAG: T9SS type A sorting domain-containing protein [candidate division WOR-3 bacterium]